MEKLVIGIPARNEAATIAPLAATLEQAAGFFAEGIRTELVLAYQPGGDDTLERWHSRRFELPQQVLYGTEGEQGKGRNVKQLVSYAREAGAHLLLVDADLRFHHPTDVAAFLGTDRLSKGGMVLPLWCRPRGQGNSTDFLASPLLSATFGARIRHPLAGLTVLTEKMLTTVDLDALPDDYGIDVALTLHALDEGLDVDQVTVPFPGHEAGGHSGQIMEEVATTMLGFLASGVSLGRQDVTLAERWWEGQTILPASTRSLEPLIDALDVSERRRARLTGMLAAHPDQVRDFWCEQLSDALVAARAGDPLAPLVSDLVGPFLVHAEYRRRLDLDFTDAEAYVVDLGTRLAATLS